MRRTAGAALAGFVGMTLAVLGASLPSSPFTSKLPGSWIFGIPTPASAASRHEVLGIAVVYGGMVVLLSAWYCLVAFPDPDPGRLRRLWGVFVLWVAPLVVAPPLFSRDVYTYGAEGQLVSRGIDPYTHGLSAVGSSPFYELADPLWRHAHAPYGPVFFDVARANATLGGSVFATLEGFRFVALLGVVLIAVSVPGLARTFGRDGGRRLRPGGAQPPRARVAHRCDAQRRPHARAARGGDRPGPARASPSRDRVVRRRGRGQGPGAPRGRLHRLAVGRRQRAGAPARRVRRRVPRRRRGGDGGGLRDVGARVGLALEPLGPGEGELVARSGHGSGPGHRARLPRRRGRRVHPRVHRGGATPAHCSSPR